MRKHYLICECAKKPGKNPEYFFYWHGKKVKITPGFKYPNSPYFCPKCHERKIKEYLKRYNVFVEKFLEINNSEISINWKQFWTGLHEHPCINPHKDGWGVYEFLCAIGVLTEQQKGWYFYCQTSGETLLLKGRDGKYCFVKEKDILAHIKYEVLYHGAKNTYGACYLSKFISNQEIIPKN